MCSGTQPQPPSLHTAVSLGHPGEQLSITAIALGMGKLRHGGGGCRVRQSKIQKGPSSGLLRYLPAN